MFSLLWYMIGKLQIGALSIYFLSKWFWSQEQGNLGCNSSVTLGAVWSTFTSEGRKYACCLVWILLKIRCCIDKNRKSFNWPHPKEKQPGTSESDVAFKGLISLYVGCFVNHISHCLIVLFNYRNLRLVVLSKSPVYILNEGFMSSQSCPLRILCEGVWDTLQKQTALLTSIYWMMWLAFVTLLSERLKRNVPEHLH